MLEHLRAFGYPSRQDGSILLAQDFPHLSLKKEFFPFINQAWLDQYVVHWPHSFNCVFSGGSRGGARGGGGAVPPFFLDQTEARRAEKTFSDTRPPLLSGSGGLPPPPLSEGLDLPLVFTENAKKDSTNIQPS